ncbi:MAG: adenosylmethionine--8-amino-7-oxononanoate transaminase [Spirochaetaceae bacterium]|nr:adenosylmethionine--8-amino-7-oxononanoate transaminase [Spirochaetaceae bacterium]
MCDSKNWIERDLRHIWHPCSQMKDYETLPPVVVDRGEGARLFGVDGKTYIDIVGSWWCNLLGHCNPHINNAIKRQLDSLEHVIFAHFSHPPAIEYAERLCAVLPAGLCKLHFSDNGSSAVECALKMSFQYQAQMGKPRKQRFMCLSEGYHGETIGALSVGAMDVFTGVFKPLLVDSIRIPAPDCYRCPYGQERASCACPCLDAARAVFERHADECCALIAEPLLQGAAGMRIYPEEYLRGLRALCDNYDVLFIADEIATGFGRTGELFACARAGISPDLMCLSKSITGGYLPFSVLAVTQPIYDAFYADYSARRAFLHSHTFSGNPLGCAAALAVLDLLLNGRDGAAPALQTARGNAVWLHETLQSALGGHPHVGEIRAINLINAIELVADKRAKTPFPPARRTGRQIYKKALELGLLLRPLGDVLYFNPPLNTERSILAEAAALCKQSIETGIQW